MTEIIFYDSFFASHSFHTYIVTGLVSKPISTNKTIVYGVNMYITYVMQDKWC